MTIALVIYHATRIVGLGILHFGRLVGGVFVKVWNHFEAFYGRVLKPFVSWAWTQITRIHNWAVKTFGPLIKNLELLRAWILRVYDRWFKPIFATIDALRATLRVLETFHVPFAAAIDRKLADLEARLLEPINEAMARINQVINWVDRIVTFDGLFQRLTLIESQWRYVGDTWAVLLKHQPAGVSAEQNAALHALKVRPVDPKRLTAALVVHYRAGAGELQPAIDELVPVWRASVAQ